MIAPNTCCINILSEIPCAWGNKAIWFKCRYTGCHGGVGHVTVTTPDGSVMYDNYPTVGLSKHVYIGFDLVKVNTDGATMTVTYKPGDFGYGGHICNKATFDWGYAFNLTQVVDTAYLDNDGGPNDLNNTCSLLGSRCNTFSIPPGSLSNVIANTPSAATNVRRVCYTGTPSCNSWIELLPKAVANINFIPAGTPMLTIPAGKTAYFALINYGVPAVSFTAANANITLHNASTGALLTVNPIPFLLTSNGSAVSPFPFDGRSIDGNPFRVENTFGVAVEVRAGPGICNSAGLYFGKAGIRIDDSLAYAIP